MTTGKRTLLPERAKAVLSRWFEDHPARHPDQSERNLLAAESGVCVTLLTKYFAARRKRKCVCDAPPQPPRKRPRSTPEDTQVDGRVHVPLKPSLKEADSYTRDEAERPRATVDRDALESEENAASEESQEPCSPPQPQEARSKAPSPASGWSEEDDYAQLRRNVERHESFALLVRMAHESATCTALGVSDECEAALHREATRSAGVAKVACESGLDAACARHGSLNVLFAALHAALSTLRTPFPPQLTPPLAAALYAARTNMAPTAHPHLRQHMPYHHQQQLHRPTTQQRPHLHSQSRHHQPPPQRNLQHQRLHEQRHQPPPPPPPPPEPEREVSPPPEDDPLLNAWFRRKRALAPVPRSDTPVFALPAGSAAPDDRHMAERTFTGLVHRILAHGTLALVVCACTAASAPLPAVLRPEAGLCRATQAHAERYGVTRTADAHGRLRVLLATVLAALCGMRQPGAPQPLAGVLAAASPPPPPPPPSVPPVAPRSAAAAAQKRGPLSAALASAKLSSFVRERAAGGGERWWAVLEAWFDDNKDDPSPDEDDAWLLAEESGLSVAQVHSYLQNKGLEHRAAQREAPTRREKKPVSAVQAIAALASRVRNHTAPCFAK